MNNLENMMSNLDNIMHNPLRAALLSYVLGAQDLKDILRLFPEGQVALSDQRIISFFDDLKKISTELINDSDDTESR